MHRYVTRKDVDANVIYVSNTYYQPDKKRDTFVCGRINWSEGDLPAWWRQWIQQGSTSPPAGLGVKLRHGPNVHDVKQVSFGRLDEDGQWKEQLPEEGASWDECRVCVQLFSDDQGLAPGQYAVFYHDNVCLGSAVIM